VSLIGGELCGRRVVASRQVEVVLVGGKAVVRMGLIGGELSRQWWGLIGGELHVAMMSGERTLPKVQLFNMVARDCHMDFHCHCPAQLTSNDVHHSAAMAHPLPM
jgi:hypothetical protein